VTALLGIANEASREMLIGNSTQVFQALCVFISVDELLSIYHPG
jgi:hypothetical protein